MDKIRIQSFLSAYKTFTELMNGSMPRNTVTRDASIQRFEYTVDTCWKALKVILLEKHGVEANFPKDTMREAFRANIINNNPLWLQMIDDRNATSHIYNENLAEEIYSRFYHYDRLLSELVSKLKDYEQK